MGTAAHTRCVGQGSHRGRQLPRSDMEHDWKPSELTDDPFLRVQQQRQRLHQEHQGLRQDHRRAGGPESRRRPEPRPPHCRRRAPLCRSQAVTAFMARALTGPTTSQPAQSRLGFYQQRKQCVSWPSRRPSFLQTQDDTVITSGGTCTPSTSGGGFGAIRSPYLSVLASTHRGSAMPWFDALRFSDTCASTLFTCITYCKCCACTVEVLNAAVM